MVKSAGVEWAINQCSGIGETIPGRWERVVGRSSERASPSVEEWGQAGWKLILPAAADERVQAVWCLTTGKRQQTGVSLVERKVERETGTGRELG
jgi:hypothetical protein